MSQPPFLSQRRSQRKIDFDKWLHTPIFLDEHDYQTAMPRKEALFYFYKEGLIPFIEHHGYIFDGTIPVFSHFVSFLFQPSTRDFLIQPVSRILDKVNIDYEYFETRGIPSEDWDAFWKTWGSMTDFCDEHQKNQYWVPSFCYNRFDLYQSPSTEVVDREYELDGSEEEGLDQMNENLVKIKDKKSMY